MYRGKQQKRIPNKQNKMATKSGKRQQLSGKQVAVNLTKALIDARVNAAVRDMRPKASNKVKAQRPKHRVTSSPLSHCAQKYALAICDPWNMEARGACVPRHPSKPSQKITLYNRFQMTIGGTGNFASVGAIVVCPSLANDAPSVFYADNVAQIQTLPSSAAQFQALLPFLKPISVNSPYTSSQFTESPGTGVGPSVQGRIVSAGISIQYMGSELNRGGTYTMFGSPNHDNMAMYPATALAGYDETFIQRITEGKQWLTLSGIDEPELVYNLGAAVDSTGTNFVTPLVYPYSNGQTLGGSVSLLNFTALTAAYTSGATSLVVTSLNGTPASSGTFSVLIPGATGSVPTTVVFTYSAFTLATNTFTVTGQSVTLAAGLTVSAGNYSSTISGCIPGGAPAIIYVQPSSTSVANTFEVEYIAHVEFIGPLTSALHTPTHSDARGFEIVNTAAARLAGERVQNPLTPVPTLMFNQIRQVINETTPAERTMIMDGVRSVAGNLMGYANSMLPSMGRLTLG